MHILYIFACHFGVIQCMDENKVYHFCLRCCLLGAITVFDQFFYFSWWKMCLKKSGKQRRNFPHVKTCFEIYYRNIFKYTKIYKSIFYVEKIKEFRKYLMGTGNVYSAYTYRPRASPEQEFKNFSMLYFFYSLCRKVNIHLTHIYNKIFQIKFFAVETYILMLMCVW